jgi:hypothetical protein
MTIQVSPSPIKSTARGVIGKKLNGKDSHRFLAFLALTILMGAGGQSNLYAIPIPTEDPTEGTSQPAHGDTTQSLNQSPNQSSGGPSLAKQAAPTTPSIKIPETLKIKVPKGWKSVPNGGGATNAPNPNPVLTSTPDGWAMTPPPTEEISTIHLEKPHDTKSASTDIIIIRIPNHTSIKSPNLEKNHTIKETMLELARTQKKGCQVRQGGTVLSITGNDENVIITMVLPPVLTPPQVIATLNEEDAKEEDVKNKERQSQGSHRVKSYFHCHDPGIIIITLNSPENEWESNEPTWNEFLKPFIKQWGIDP